MCEIGSCLSMSFVDSLVSVLIFVLNCFYVLWGWVTPNDPAREELEEYIQKLKSYLNFVTYSDSIMLMVKVIVILIIKYMLCKSNDNTEVSDNTVQSPKLFNFNVLTPKKTSNTFEV